MKISAHYQFYLPYLLPRGSDWKGNLVAMEIGPFEVHVVPRDSDEPVILPTDEFTLGMTSQFTSVSDKHSVSSNTVKDRCCDRIGVSVFGNVDSIEAVNTEFIKNDFIDTAIGAANLFIEHCRLIVKQPSITNLTRSILSANSVNPAFPYSEVWCDSENKPLTGCRVHTGALPVLFQNHAKWEKIGKSLSNAMSPNLAQVSLMDARASFNEENLREALIYMAIACESASNIYLNHSEREKDGVIGKILKGNKTFAEKRFHLITMEVSKRSLKKDDHETFLLAEKMYQTRNSLMHSGVLNSLESINTLETIRRIGQFLSASEKAVAWLFALMEKPQ